HTAGSLLARQPHADSAFGQRFADFPDQLARIGNAPGNAPRIVSPIDGVARYTAVRVATEYPLVVAVSRDVGVVLAPWRAQALGTALRTVALSGLAGCFLVLLIRKLARLQATQDKLAAMKERFALAVAGSDDGIWDWDQKTNRVFSSARTRELYGLPPGPE